MIHICKFRSSRAYRKLHKLLETRIIQAHDKKAFFLQSSPLRMGTLNRWSTSTNVPLSISYICFPALSSSERSSRLLSQSRQSCFRSISQTISAGGWRMSGSVSLRREADEISASRASVKISLPSPRSRTFIRGFLYGVE